MLDDIHDFDLLFWFADFSPVKTSHIFTSKLSNLDIDVEDICNALFQFQNGIIGNVRCNYLEQYKHKEIKIVGEKGSILWDFRGNAVWFESMKKSRESRRKIFRGAPADDERSYFQELKYFFSCLENRRSTFNDVSMAFQTLKSIKK